MSESTPRDALKAFRDLYVEERRRVVAVALDLRQANGDGGLHGAQLKTIQDQIEAIDRAMEDERRLEPSVYEKRGLLGC